ncbi:MAG: alkaline phosphatase family protein [Candidatus Hydrogenedentes bacterium]|nr:alkaline phosphatase family protein [Candidatus Hydrogenedentota bacterium]
MSRFLLVGLDGAEPSLVEAWMEEGRLPHLAALREQGSILPCASTTPPATFPAWTTCVTGVNPGRHGVFDFTEIPRGKYELRFVNATDRKAPALWNILSDAGKRVCVLGVPGTYPPGPVNGILVSGFDSPVCTAIDRSFVYPESVYPEVRGWRFADFQETHIGPGWHDRVLPKLLDGIATKERIALSLLEKEPWDFFMVVFGESDTVSHHFWMFHDLNSPRHAPGHSHAIRDVYARLDVAVGRLMAAAGPGTTIGVVSDHGFGGAGTGVVHLNNWLAEKGYLRFTPSHDSWLKAMALRYVPDGWKGALFRRLGGLAARAESRSRFGGIDWAHTRAWSEELNYFPSLRVNLRGREPDGQVAGDDYGRFCDELCHELESWPVIHRAWRREELYQGPHIERAPDIILELALEQGYSHSCLRSRGGPAFRRVGPDEYVGGKERGMNGNHRPTGVLFLSKPASTQQARLEDIAPTVLEALGVPAPAMDGIGLIGQVGQVGPSAVTGLALPPPRPYSQSEERAIEDRLRSLGYYE